MSAPLSIPLPKHFSFDEALTFLARSDREILHRVDGKRWLQPYADQDRICLLEIGEDAGRLLVNDVLADGPPPESAVGYVRESLDLHRDLQPFVDLLAADGSLRELGKTYRGLRVVRIPDLFQTLAWTIIGQQINLSFAYTLKRRLVENVGQEVGESGLFLFPSAAEVLKLDAEDLRAMQFSRQKADYLLHLAAAIAEGRISRRLLEAMPDRIGQVKAMLSLRGIGPWSAEYALLKCLGDPKGFPITDVGLHNALRHLHKMDEKPSLNQIRNWAEGWEGWQGYVTFYLWRSLLDK